MADTEKNNMKMHDNIEDFLASPECQVFLNQAFLATVKKLVDDKDEYRISVADVDATGQDMLAFRVDEVTKEIVFKLSKKS